MEEPHAAPPRLPQPSGPCASNGVVLHRVISAHTQQHRSNDQSSGTEHDAAKTAAETRFVQLLEGLDAPGDSGNPPEKPPWLDMELFERGRRFYQRYLFCVFISDLVALLAMFSVGRILRPLLYTKRSDTPFKALRRYVSTINRVILWYSGDLWSPEDQAHKDILKVRSIHASVAATFNSANHRAGVDEATARGDRGANPPPSGCPFHTQGRESNPGVTERVEASPGLYLSQWDMTFTQYCFMGVMIAHPWRMGAWWVKEEEMEGLIHFWRGCGWLLGIQDRYNFCAGNVEETRALCHEMEKEIVRPCLARAGRDTEHLGKALLDGISSLLPWFSYPAMVRFLGDTMRLNLPSVRRSMSLKHRSQYVFLRVLLHGLFLIPGVVWVFNEVLKFSLSYVQGHNTKWKPKVRVFPFTYA